MIKHFLLLCVLEGVEKAGTNWGAHPGDTVNWLLMSVTN